MLVSTVTPFTEKVGVPLLVAVIGSSWVAEVFIEVRSELGAVVGPCCTDAWTSPPISSARGMNLDGWGPTDVDAQLRLFERALRFRFGWQRWIALARWHPGA